MFVLSLIDLGQRLNWWIVTALTRLRGTRTLPRRDIERGRRYILLKESSRGDFYRRFAFGSGREHYSLGHHRITLFLLQAARVSFEDYATGGLTSTRKDWCFENPLCWQAQIARAVDHLRLGTRDYI